MLERRKKIYLVLHNPQVILFELLEKLLTLAAAVTFVDVLTTAGLEPWQIATLLIAMLQCPVAVGVWYGLAVHGFVGWIGNGAWALSKVEYNLFLLAVTLKLSNRIYRILLLRAGRQDDV